MIKHIAFVFGFVVIGLLFGGVSANASAVSVPDDYNWVPGAEYTDSELKSKYGNYVHWSYSGEHNIVILRDSHLKFYMDGNRMYVYNTSSVSSSTYSLFFKKNGNWSISGNTTIDPLTVGSLPNSVGITINDSTRNVYTSKDGNESFFTAPNPYVMKGLTTVEEVPKVMKSGVGGLISTGLMVLAILLGVSLIPRLVYSFLR